MIKDKCATSRGRAFGRPMKVRVSDIQSDPRFARRAVDHTLAENVFRYGLQSAIIVRKTERGFVVVAGEKRLMALRFLATQVPKNFEYTWVYPLVIQVSDDDAAYLHELSNCLAREGASEADRNRLLSYYESLSTTYMYRRWRSEEPWHFIAAMTGVPRATLMRIKSVQANAIPEVRKMVDVGQLSMRSAAENVAKWPREDQEAFVARVKAERLSDEKAIQALVREFKPEPPVSTNKLTRELKTLEKALKKGETTVDYRTAKRIFDSAQSILAMSTEAFNESRRKPKE